MVCVAVAVLALAGASAIAIGLVGPSRSASSAGGTTTASGHPEAPPGSADASARPEDVVGAAAAAMAEVTSVEFRLECSGAPVFIDQFGSIALEDLVGRYRSPGRAAAVLQVRIDANLITRLGAIAVGEQVWVSNPVTGLYEALPSGFDLDPSRFFDPRDGWAPLLSSLSDVELVSIAERGGERYHVRGTAPARQVADLTVGLVNDQDLLIDLWVHPLTSLVTDAEFTTSTSGSTTEWTLALGRYGDEFVIEPPANGT